MILDTDILIDIDRGHSNALAWIASLTALPMISGFAALELIQGCRNKSEMTKVETFLSVFPIVWPDEADMQWTFANYGQYRLTHNIVQMHRRCCGMVSCPKDAWPQATQRRNLFRRTTSPVELQ